ncbi:hypothetical protein NA56DRAFT_713652 [Hyaloscypha hepaticicola]|uniref:Uncharacterized protein n=1 Tax=Hyaloscypha hepaticicola TaxID=2082293 RepID=A0A2J6PDJ7_9HELO|nr:hypothetical protein NA56DRAFT_713652 [Hyaloscypha hepaticicola]
MYYNYDNNSEPECNDNSKAGDDTGSDDNVLFDSENEGSDNSTADTDMDGPGYLNNGYNSNGTDITIIENTDKYYITELNEYRQSLYYISDPVESGEFEKAKRKYKVLYYEDIYLWIV